MGKTNCPHVRKETTIHYKLIAPSFVEPYHMGLSQSTISKPTRDENANVEVDG